MPDASLSTKAPATLGRAVSHHGWLLLFTLIWGGNFVLAEVALRELAPIAFSVSRFLMGGLAMWVIFYWGQTHVQSDGQRRRWWPKIARKDVPRLVVVGLFGAMLAPWLGIEGLNLTHAGRASLWAALGPILSAAIGLILRTERLGRYGYAGLILAGAGTLGLALDGLAPGRGYGLGDLLLVTAITLVAAEMHLIKPLADRYGAAPTVALRTLIGGTCYTLVAAPTLAIQPWMGLSTWVWVAIFVGGVVGIGVGQWIQVRALRVLSPTRVVLYHNLVPLAALVLAWLFLGTTPSQLEWVAGACIILGALALHVLDPAHRHEHRA